MNVDQLVSPYKNGEILHFRKFHNTSCLPSKILHNDCIQFLLGHDDDPREIENNGYANIWRLKEDYYGIFESREWRFTF